MTTEQKQFGKAKKGRYYFIVANYKANFHTNTVGYIAAFAGTNKKKAESKLKAYKENYTTLKGDNNMMYYVDSIYINPIQDNIYKTAKLEISNGIKPVSHKIFDNL